MGYMHIWYLYTQAALQLLQVASLQFAFLHNFQSIGRYDYHIQGSPKFWHAGDEFCTKLADILECGHWLSNNSQNIGWFQRTHIDIQIDKYMYKYTNIQIDRYTNMKFVFR